MRFAIATFVILFIWACKDGPQPIKYGVEACYYCKMSIVDNRYAVQIINKKRKVYNFDDIYCCREILSEGGIKTEDIAAMYINDYIRPGVLVHRDSSLLLYSEKLRTPMGGNIAAFSSREAMEQLLPEVEGREISWEEALAPLQ